MPVAGVLLTGGGSRRLGSPKALLEVRGERLADRSARVLQAVCDPVVEVGPGASSLPAVREEPAGAGPLVALVAGGAWLRARGHSGAVIVLAVDLPAVDEPLLRWLAGRQGAVSVVPVVGGRAQSLCARYSAEALTAAEELVGRGERSMRALLAAIDARYVDETDWGSICAPSDFVDVDTPADAARAGVDVVTPNSPPASSR